MPEIGNSRRRHPHQIYVAGLCTLTGLPVVLGGVQPGSLSATMPHALVWLWAVCLLVGGLLVLTAGLVRSLLTALYLELVADLPVALSMASYATAIVLIDRLHHPTAAVTFAGAAAAFFVRFVQVMRAFRRLNHELARRAGER